VTNFEEKKVAFTYEEKVEEYLLCKRIEGVSKETLTTYQCHLYNIGISSKQLFDDIDWRKVICAIHDRTNLKEYSKSSYLKSLRAFIRWANINIKVVIPKVETVKETYTDEELKKLIAKPLNYSFAELRTWALVLLALDTGLRSSSIRCIRISDIQDNTVAVRHSKTRKVRVLPFSQSTMYAIKVFMHFRGGTESDFLFCDTYGRQLTADALKHAVMRYNHSRGVKKTSIHMFRHTFAKKFLLDCGGNPYSLQKMLMHSTMEMTRQYCNIFDADLIQSYVSPLESLSHKRIIVK